MRDYKGASGMLTIEFADGYTKEDAVKSYRCAQVFCLRRELGRLRKSGHSDGSSAYGHGLEQARPVRPLPYWLEDAQDLIEDLGQALDKISHK